MTIDKSLKIRRGMSANRSVLTRAERLAKLKDADRWTEGDSPLGIPKVRVHKLLIKKKKKAAKEEDEGTDTAAAPAADSGPKSGPKSGAK